MITIVHSSIQDFCASYDGAPFHAVLTDPPYEIGVMALAWDASGVAFDPATWRGILELLHPGALGFAFAAARGYHRQAVAIEDAGGEIQSMLSWHFRTGMPKATRLDLAADRAAGATPRLGALRTHTPKFAVGAFGYPESGYNSRTRTTYNTQEATSPLGVAWQGHRYGVQALKPAMEPIACFRRPHNAKSRSAQILATGAGAYDIDGGKIGDRAWRRRGGASRAVYGGGLNLPEPGGGIGFWPSNVILCHTEDCDEARGCAPGCPVATHHGSTEQLYCADYARERIEDADPLVSAAKPSCRERNAGLSHFPSLTIDDGGTTKPRYNPHPTIKPIALTRYLAALLLPPPCYAPRRILVPFAGVMSEAIGAHLAGWDEVVAVEMNAEYIPAAQARVAFWADGDRADGDSATGAERQLRMFREGN